jgi:putative inorganic carbon (hco3(-)) transporter
MERFLFQLRKTPLLLFGVLTAVVLLASFLIAMGGVGAAIAILILLAGLCVAAAVFSNYKNGFLMMVVYSYFFFEIGRLMPIELPLGAFVEVFLILITLSILVHRHREGIDGSAWEVFRNPIGTALLVYSGYAMLEMFNPYSHSISARLVGIRETVMMLLLFFSCMHVFTNFNYIKYFTKFWLFFALLAALYGIYQEIFGMPAYAMAWLMKGGPEAYKLAFIWGHLRVWSFMSDISGFGLYMAYAAIICLILALGPFKPRQRIILVVCALLMLISMGYSGTRTATAMILMGFAFYVLMTLNKRITLAFAICGAMGFAALMWGPFYSGPILRMRTTFKGSEDASMNVRDQKRIRLQPFIRSHPIGWGLNTVGNLGTRLEPGHRLAGPYDTDSGFLRVALERGWIGLILILYFYAAAMIHGVTNYYKAEREDIKIFYAAYLAAFFAISVAHFTQDATDQKPIVIIIMASFVFFIKMIKFDKTGKTESTS